MKREGGESATQMLCKQRPGRLLLSLASAALVSACAAASERVLMESTDISVAYDRKEFFFAASAGEIEVLMLGGAPEDEVFVRHVLEGVAANLPRRDVQATLDPNRKPQGDHRIVMAFGAEGAVDRDRLCGRARYRARAGTGDADAGRATARADGDAAAPRRVHAAFCRGSTHLTSVRARLPAAARAPEDVERLAGAATRQLFPFRNPQRDQNGKFVAGMWMR